MTEREQQHKTIWLAPSCNNCAGEERTWCQDDVYDPCEECGRLAVKYVLAHGEQGARDD